MLYRRVASALRMPMMLCIAAVGLNACSLAPAPGQQLASQFGGINYTSPLITGAAPRDYTRTIFSSANF